MKLLENLKSFEKKKKLYLRSHLSKEGYSYHQSNFYYSIIHKEATVLGLKHEFTSLAIIRLSMFVTMIRYEPPGS